MTQPLTDKQVKERLDSVIQIALDTQLGYHAAAEHVKNPELATLCQDYAIQRQSFITQLRSLVPYTVTEKPVQEPSPGGKMQAGWIGFREAINWENEKVVVAEIGKMEEHAVKDLESVLQNNNLPAPVAVTLGHQLALYREGADRAKQLYQDPNLSDRGPVPGTHTTGTGSPAASHKPVPRS